MIVSLDRPLGSSQGQGSCVTWTLGTILQGQRKNDISPVSHEQHYPSQARGQFVPSNASRKAVSSSCRRQILQLAAAALSGVLVSALMLHVTSVSPAGSQWLLRQGSEPNLHLLLPLDKHSHGNRSCKTLLAALVHGYEPTIINWDLIGPPDVQYSSKISGALLKESLASNAPQTTMARVGTYEHIVQNLTHAPDDDFVFMADSFDIWLQQSPRALIRRFRELNGKIVIGTDQWCWPNDPNSVRLNRRAFCDYLTPLARSQNAEMRRIPRYLTGSLGKRERALIASRPGTSS